VSRGGIVDEHALLEALRSDRLSGAVLDVFDTEPLDPQSVWWTEPKVILTPHVAGLTPDYGAHVEHILTENLRRFLAGSPLMNVADRVRGY
jgi:phosphoglycerate dehydrogenase-like enzyme